MNTALDAVLLLLMFATAALVLLLRYRLAHKRLDVARYHAHADIRKWTRTTLLGRKEVRICPDCGVPVHDYKRQELHSEHHQHLDGLADRIAAIEQLVAEARGGGVVEEPAPVPDSWLSGELTEHAGAVDVTAGELEARAADPEPEQVLRFREKYGSLIRP